MCPKTLKLLEHFIYFYITAITKYNKCPTRIPHAGTNAWLQMLLAEICISKKSTTLSLGEGNTILSAYTRYKHLE